MIKNLKICVSVLIFISVIFSLCFNNENNNNDTEKLENVLDLKINKTEGRITINSTFNITISLKNNGKHNHKIDHPSLVHGSLLVNISTPNGLTVYHIERVLSLPKAIEIGPNEIIKNEIIIGGRQWNDDIFSFGKEKGFRFNIPGNYSIDSKYISGRADDKTIENCIISSNIIYVEVI